MMRSPAQHKSPGAARTPISLVAHTGRSHASAPATAREATPLARIACGSTWTAVRTSPILNQGAGLRALRAFCMDTGLPKPSLIVDSGNGLHTYWHFGEDIEKKKWFTLAKELKALTEAKGLMLDPKRTADIASVLRVPGTLNFKDASNPKPVRILHASVGHNLNSFISTLNARALPSPQASPVPSAGWPPRQRQDLAGTFCRSHRRQPPLRSCAPCLSTSRLEVILKGGTNGSSWHGFGASLW